MPAENNITILKADKNAKLSRVFFDNLPCAHSVFYSLLQQKDIKILCHNFCFTKIIKKNFIFSKNIFHQNYQKQFSKNNQRIMYFVYPNFFWYYGNIFL